MPHDGQREHGWLVIGFLLLGILARLVPHPPNVTPLVAIALFGGTYGSKRWAVLLPLLIVAASDLVLGWHDTIPFTWGAFVLTGMLAWWLRAHPTALRIAVAAAASAFLFFVITNFGVWVAGTLYPRTAEGLWHCYVAAVPFFRNTLLGDLAYTAVFFGGYAAAASVTLAGHPSH